MPVRRQPSAAFLLVVDPLRYRPAHGRGERKDSLGRFPSTQASTRTAATSGHCVLGLLCACARQSERSVHYQRVHEPQNRMLETLRNRSDNVESKMTPKLDRALVGTDHAVELHGLEASRSRVTQRVLAHRRCNTLADRSSGAVI